MEHFEDAEPMGLLFDKKEDAPAIAAVELFGKASFEAFRTILTHWHLPELELSPK
jgi:hypothetical protein